MASNNKKSIINKGDRYTRLCIIEEVPKAKGNRRFLCRCDCGKEKVVGLSSLKTGATKSCGCYHSDQASSRKMKLGLPRKYSGVKDRTIPEFKVWLTIVTRCYNPKSVVWHQYGGKGIKMSADWLQEDGKGFYQFMEDMGSRPPKHNIDRIDPSKDYCKENCRWVDASLSSFNCGLSSRNTSGVSGVCWHKKLGKWTAKIGKNYKRIHLGCFDSFEDAVAARRAAELLYFGENCP